MIGDTARIVDVLPGAAGTLAPARRAMIVQLQGYADDLVSRFVQQPCYGTAVHSTGHGDEDTH